MQRIVTDPAGTSWDVHVEWIGRRVATDTMLGRFRRRRQQRAHRRRALAAEADAQADGKADDKKSKWHDNLDLPDPGGCVDADGLVIFLLLFVGFVLIWFGGPFALALLLGLGEFALVLFAALAVFGWRTAARRPWIVVARSRTTEHRWSISGYRRANRLVEAAAASIANGHVITAVDALLFDTPLTTSLGSPD